MAKYEITQRCSVGSVGEVIEVKGELTARQSVYLKPLNSKVEVIAGDGIKELKELKAANAELTKELKELKAANAELTKELKELKAAKSLEVATPEDSVSTQSTQQSPKGKRG